MASHLNENSKVKETLLSEEKKSKRKRDSGRLRRRRRRAPHPGTPGSEFTATTGISEAKQNILDRRYYNQRAVQRPLVENMKVYQPFRQSDLKRRLPKAKKGIVDLKKPSSLQEAIPGALQDQQPIANDDEADLIGQETVIDDEPDLVHQKIQMPENAPDGPLLAMANNQDGWRLKDVLIWVFPITNFTMELPSAVFDKLSSKDHPYYALIVMLISFIALVACIAELIYKGKKERVTWQWRGRVPWFYCPQTGKPFSSLWDIIGFAHAFLQCVVTAINYSFISRHLDGPIKASASPILFAFGLLCSKYFEKPGRNRGGKPDGGSAAALVQVRVER